MVYPHSVHCFHKSLQIYPLLIHFFKKQHSQEEVERHSLVFKVGHRFSPYVRSEAEGTQSVVSRKV